MDRTVKAVETRIQKLGLSKIVRTRWTKNEEKRLKKLAPNHTLKELSDLFGNRSIYSIEHKIKELGISYNKIKNKLTEEDIKYIEENYQEKTITELAAHLKVGTTLITSCTKSLGLSKDKVTKWTPEEIKRLQELALTKNVNELASEFNTSPRGITAIAGKNNIKLLSSIHMWTDEEVEKLKKLNGEGKTIVEIQEELNIDGDSIRSKLHKLKLPINRSLTTWTEDELNTLLIKYEELSNNYTGSKYEFLCKISEELPKKGILTIICIKKEFDR